MYGLSIPLSINLANSQFVYNYDLPPIQLPSYSFVGVSPTYRWATLHAGDRSMTFSPYTLSGHSFRGVGTELKPGSMYFGAMYGRLQRANAQDLNSLQDIDPLYKRMAWGVKAGYDTGEEHLYAIVFKSWDDITSSPAAAEQNDIAPAENMVVSLQGKKQLTKSLSLSVDYALSGITEDQRMNRDLSSNVFTSFLGLYQARVNSEYLSAIKSSLAYQFKWGDVNLNHEWVEPGYRTLGALFFNNDFENWTIGTNTQFFNKMFSLQSNVGIERNNLHGTALNTAVRLVGSWNLTFLLNEKFNINSSYSNFKSTNKQSALIQPQLLVDSIILTQVNESASITTAYVMGEEQSSTISAMFSFNRSNNIENDQVNIEQAMSNYTASLSHSYVFSPLKLTLTSAMLINWNQTTEQQLKSYAPTFDVSQSFFDGKLKSSTTFSYIFMYTNNLHTNNILNWQANLSYVYREKHNLGLSFGLVKQKRNQITETEIEDQNFIEMVGRLNYQWSF